MIAPPGGAFGNEGRGGGGVTSTPKEGAVAALDATEHSREDDEASNARECNRAQIDEQNAESQFFGLVRDIRVHCQDLLYSLGNIEGKQELHDPIAREKETLTAILEYNEVVLRDSVRIELLLSKVHKLLEHYSNLYDGWGDVISQVEVHWNRVLAITLSSGIVTDENLRRVKVITELSRQIVFQCAFLTIPSRVNEHLILLRPGQSLDFHENFRDELPEVNDRTEVLKFLSSHPIAISGIVDIERGVILCIARNRWRRRLSSLLIAFAMLVGAGLLTTACWVGRSLNSPSWPFKPEHCDGIMIAYLFVLLGGAGHIVIAALKQERAATAKTLQALEDWLLWIHVKERAILVGIFYLWIALFGYAWIKQGAVDWATAFFIGYSIDSIVDLVLQRFDKAISTGTESIKKQLA